MSIIQMTSTSSTKGYGVSLAANTLHSELVERGIRSEIYSIDDGIDENNGSLFPDAEKLIFKFQHSIHPILRYSKPLLNTLMHRVSDDCIVHQQSDLFTGVSLMASKVKRATKASLVLSPHGVLSEFRLNLKKERKKLTMLLFEGRHLSSVDYFHALNISEAHEIRNLGITKPIFIIPNGYKFSSVPEISNSNPIKKNECDSKSTMSLLYIGRLGPEKGVRDLILSWKKAECDRYSMKLIICGPNKGNQINELKQLVESLNLSSSISFEEAVYNQMKLDKIAGSDLVVLPSKAEGDPMIILEAFSLKKAVLVTKECNWPKVEELGIGFLSGTTVDELARKLQEIATFNINEIRRKGILGWEYAKQARDWKYITNQYIHMYSSIKKIDENPNIYQEIFDENGICDLTLQKNEVFKTKTVDEIIL